MSESVWQVAGAGEVSMVPVLLRTVEAKHGKTGQETIDVYDCFLVLETHTPNMHGGPFDKRTMLWRDFEQSIGESQQKAGYLVAPTVKDVLGMAVTITNIIECETFQSWAVDWYAGSEPAKAIHAGEVWGRWCDIATEVRAFLGDDIDVSVLSQQLAN